MLSYTYIAVIEDDPIIAEWMKERLEGTNPDCPVKLFSSAAEALANFIQCKPVAAVLDIYLRDNPRHKDGLDLLRELSDRSARPTANCRLWLVQARPDFQGWSDPSLPTGEWVIPPINQRGEK